MNRKKKHWSVLGLALGSLVLGLLVGLLTVGTVAADPTPGVMIQIPRVDVGDEGNGYWETWIQVQNVGDEDTGAIFLGWGEYSALCPTNDPGAIAHYCQLIRVNSIWTLRTQIDEDVKSGIIYSVSADVFQEACFASALTEGDKIAWACWVEEWKYGTCEDAGGGWNDPPEDAYGEDLAVTVNRYGPNDYGTFVSSTYTGISEEMEGEGAPDTPPYEYYAPYVMKGYNGLDTEMTIQNSGDVCTSVWINYMEQGSCNVLYKQHFEQLAPGEAIRTKVPCDVGQIPCFWLGSAHIAAQQPLGIIVDETSFDEPCVGVDRGTLLTHRARPKAEVRDGEPIEDTKVYADLIFREWSGWDASIQVQNLSRDGRHTFVTVDFMDNSGDEVLFLADWVCPGGSATFYLPIVTNLGFEYVGAAEIQSHAQIDYPGGETPAQPIFVVVDLKKPDDPFTPEMDAQGGSYNAHPESQKNWVKEIALPFMAKDAQDMYTPWTSMIAIRNNSNCNKIKPRIDFRDETGSLLCFLDSFWLRPKHLKMIDLNNIGCLHPGYIGSATVTVDQVEQLCDVDQDGVVDQEPTMPSVIVVEKGIGYGDITKIYEGTPYLYEYWPCNLTISGHVIDELTLDPIEGAVIEIDGVPQGDPTDSTGYFSFPYTSTADPNGQDITVEASAAGYDDLQIVLEDVSCDDQVVNFELYGCDEFGLSGNVEDKMTGEPVEGATVRALNCMTIDDPVNYPDGWVEDTTDVAGDYDFTLPYDNDCTTWVWAFKEVEVNPGDFVLEYNSSTDSLWVPQCDWALVDFQLHQTPESRVLLYYGNGGWDDGTNYDELKELFEDLGYIVDYTDQWPTAFDWTLKYKLIVLLAPGHDSGEVLLMDGFTWGQKADLDYYLQQQGSLVILSDATSFTGHGVENDLLTDLPVELEFGTAGGDWTSGHGDQITPDECLVTNVQTYSAVEVGIPDNWTDVSSAATATPGDLILQNPASGQCQNCPMYAADVPSHGNGIVIVLGDLHGLSDAAYMSNFNWPADNEWVAFDWILCDP